MGWIISIIAGALAGWIASKIMNNDAQMGAIANIVVGIVGGVIGNWVAGLAGLEATGGQLSVGSIAISVLGACILLALIGLFTKRR